MSFNQATMKTTELIFFLYSLANSLQNSTMFNINSYLFSTLIALEKKNHESVSHDQHGLFKPFSRVITVSKTSRSDRHQHYIGTLKDLG